MAGAGGIGAGVGGLDMGALEGVRAIVLKPSESLDEARFTRISGADFNDAGLGLDGLLGSLVSTGFQASNLGDAVDVVNQMLDWRLSHEKPGTDCDEAELDPKYRESVKCKIFLGFTSNLVSSGIRDVIRFLVQHHMVDVIVTTAGGIEEDLIKCLAPTYKGDFSLPGAPLRSKGLNRIGNQLVPNDNYCKFENWIMPLFDQMLLEQSTEREMEAVLENQDAAVEEPRHEKERSSISRHSTKPSAADRWEREEDADVHLANKVMHNKPYNMSKSVEDEHDFGDAPSKKGKRKNKEAHEEKRSTRRHLLTQKELCLYCFENPSRPPKHLVVAIGNFTYLMLPQFEPVVPGHCVILPCYSSVAGETIYQALLHWQEHESATRTVDRNVWEEIRNFKKCLLKMFAQQDKDVVFMETVISLAKQRRHCMIECIAVPHEVSNNAPMYFKKAIDEAEEEWAQHEMKKLIPTKGNLSQVIPENFAYFHVEFGLDRGFVHVIDDESKFSAGFGLNVIRGMLRLPEEDMHRRRRHESMDKQKQAVASFMKDWEPFDWTKQLD